MSFVLASLPGCTPPKEEIPSAEIKVVEAYGLSLDESAPPKQVAYALLRSLAADVQAAQSHKSDEQKAALKTTFSLAAYSEIEARLLEIKNRDSIKPQKSLGAKRDRQLFNVVKNWAPIVAHYIRSFDTNFEDAAGRMQLSKNSDEKRTHVYYDVSHDPSETDPEKQQTATIDIELVKEEAGVQSYWRVARVGFRDRAVGARKTATTQPISTATAPN